MAKKKSGLSPTFKAGLMVIVAFALVWVVLTFNEPWYKNEALEAPPIDLSNTQQDTTTDTNTDVTETTDTSNSIETASDATSQEPSQTEETTEETTDENQMDQDTTDSFDKNLDVMSLDNTTIGWSFRRNTDHTPVIGYNEGVPLEDYDAYYIVETDEKVVYLTFDEGYENGFSAEILDTLAKHDIEAAFFCTESYIRLNPELAKRMKEEGHVVGNHSVNHYSMPSLDYETSVAEILGVETTMEEKTGYQLDPFFRPPMGEFSERSLYITRQQGYKTIFWSMAYQDWNVDNQPGKEVAYEHVMSNVHPGAVILLHAVSESNTQALDDILTDLTAEGYRFGSLYEIQSPFITAQ